MGWWFQANYLASTDYRLFKSRVWAFEGSPIIEKIVPYSKQCDHQRLRMPTSFPLMVEFLDAIWLRFGQLSAATLRELTSRAADRVDGTAGVVFGPGAGE